jgi:phage terminase Nu1 subunit (DNA packaging protein)
MARSCRLSLRGFDGRNVQPVGRIGREVFFDCAAVLEAEREARAKRETKVDEAADARRMEAEREKLLLMRSQREAQEMKNKALRRELVPAHEVRWSLDQVSKQLTALFDAIPMRIKTIAPRLTTNEITGIRRELIQIQNIASEIEVDFDQLPMERLP